MNTFKLEQNIFIVDDDTFCLSLYEQYIRNLGFQKIKTFESGQACLDALNENPTIIFLDHMMHPLNGIDVLKKIKRHNPNIYVVTISGQEDIKVSVDTLKYGAFDYIIKGDDALKNMERVLAKIEQIATLLKKKGSNPLNKLKKLFISPLSIFLS